MTETFSMNTVVFSVVIGVGFVVVQFLAALYQSKRTLLYPVEVEQIITVEQRLTIEGREYLRLRIENHEPAHPVAEEKLPIGDVTPCDDPEKSCRICYQNERNYVAIPCGHILLCADCVTKLTKDSCPMCRQPTSSWQRVYDT